MGRHGSLQSPPDKHHFRTGRQLLPQRQQLLPLSTPKERNFPNYRLHSEIQRRTSRSENSFPQQCLACRKSWNVRHCLYRLWNRNLLDPPWRSSLEVEENDTESETFLSTLVDKLSNALKGRNQDLGRFKQQQMFQDEKQELVNRLKFRLYADLQSNSIPNCGFYDFCFQQINKTDAETNRIVPISVLLCPLSVIIDPAERFVANCRDVNADLFPHYCSIFNKFEEIVAETIDFRRGKKRADRLCLLQFEKIVVEFKGLLRNNLKIAVLKVRATQIASKEAENSIRIAETVSCTEQPAGSSARLLW